MLNNVSGIRFQLASFLSFSPYGVSRLRQRAFFCSTWNSSGCLHLIKVLPPVCCSQSRGVEAGFLRFVRLVAGNQMLWLVVNSRLFVICWMLLVFSAYDPKYFWSANFDLCWVVSPDVHWLSLSYIDTSPRVTSRRALAKLIQGRTATQKEAKQNFWYHGVIADARLMFHRRMRISFWWAFLLRTCRIPVVWVVCQHYMYSTTHYLPLKGITKTTALQLKWCDV